MSGVENALVTQSSLREETSQVPYGPTEFSLGDIFQAIRGGKLLILRATLAGTVLATVLALLVPDSYTSTAQLMPPDQQSIASPSSLNPLAGAGLMLGGGASGLISQRTPGQTVIGIMTSNLELDSIIDKYNLRGFYRKQYIEDARKALLAHSEIAEDKKSGLVQISVTSKDKTLAHNLAAAYVDRCIQIMGQLGTSSASRERVFLEQRLKEIKVELDASTNALGQFSSHNATIDIQRQGAATMESASRLQAQLIAAESDVSGLRTRYTDDSPQVRAAQARIEELHRQLNSISGVGQSSSSGDLSDNEITPSIRKLPLLAGRYSDLYRNVMTQDVLYQTLAKQYELARVEESKEIPLVRVLDAASYPEKKSGPHRSIIIGLGAALSCLATAMWVLTKRYWGGSFVSHQAG
jgi:uncharacterized protein involved in exopolysaccharide biosynthesis